MSKLSGHSSDVFPTTQTNIQYNPKLEAIEEKPDKGIPIFNKMPKRNIEFAHKTSYRGIENTDELRKGYKAVEAKKSIPLFGKSKVFLENYDSFGLPRFLVVRLS